MEVFSGKGGSAILMMLPKDFSNQVIEWGGKMVSPDKLSGVPNKGYDKSPHITLATGIIDDTPEKAFDLLEKYGPFTVTLGDVDCFRKHDKGYDVVKINVESPVIQELNETLLDNVEVSDPLRPFSPHITLAYVKPLSCEHLIGNSDFKGMEIPIDAYVYSDREKGGRVVPLGKGKPPKKKAEYGLQDIVKTAKSIYTLSSRDLGRVIIALQYSNKT